MIVGLFSAFLLGFWGSLHCVGMCGGIVGILNNSLAKQCQDKAKWKFWLVYNVSRILSYSVAGGISAWVGSGLFTMINPEQAQRTGTMRLRRARR